MTPREIQEHLHSIPILSMLNCILCRSMSAHKCLILAEQFPEFLGALQVQGSIRRDKSSSCLESHLRMFHRLLRRVVLRCSGIKHRAFPHSATVLSSISRSPFPSHQQQPYCIPEIQPHSPQIIRNLHLHRPVAVGIIDSVSVFISILLP